MFRTRVALLGTLALFIVSGITASTALASGGPFWHVAGSKLAQGTRQLNLQVKGKAVLSSSISGLPVVVECSTSSSEGATIEGSGAQKPGQGKGRLTFSTCTTTISGNGSLCKVVEPIKTNQTKTILATFAGSQSKYAALFEPQQGETFTTLEFVDNEKECPAKGGNPFPVKGNVAAEVIPKEQESQEGLLNFPKTAIAKVFLFNGEGQPQEKLTGLKLGAVTATFSAGYGSKLATGEPFGVFST